jgi:hypothetical protein
LDPPPSFSQEQGLEPLPEPLGLGQLSPRARNELWSVFLKDLDPHSADGIRSDDLAMVMELDLREPWLRILADYHRNRLHLPPDEFRRSSAACTSMVKQTILNAPFNKVFDLVQFTLQHASCPSSVLAEIKNVLDGCNTAYTVSKAGPRIVPRSLPQEVVAFEQAYADLLATTYGGARAHLGAAADHLTAGSYADSIRESIHAVEAVAKLVSGHTGGALDPALNALGEEESHTPRLQAGPPEALCVHERREGHRASRAS